jgi:hypothetical protein
MFRRLAPWARDQTGGPTGQDSDKSRTTGQKEVFLKGELKSEFHTEEAILSLLQGNPMVALEQVTGSRK